MRIAIISDIHANFRALQAVLADIAEQDITEIISLGDNIGYGPEPEEVIQALREHGVISIMGNHELALANAHYFARLHPGPQESLTLNRQLMSSASLAWATNLPPLLLRHQARFIHGCPPRSITSYLYAPSMTRLARIFAGYPERLCFFGHLHSLERYCCDHTICHQEQVEPGIFTFAPQGRYLLNPGSVGQPRDDINRQAKYGIWDTTTDSLEIRQLPYDAATTKRLLTQRHFPEMNAFRL